MSARVHRVVFASLVSLTVFALAGITAASASEGVAVDEQGPRTDRAVTLTTSAKATLTPRLAAGANLEAATTVTRISPRRSIERAQPVKVDRIANAKAKREMVVAEPRRRNLRSNLKFRAVGLNEQNQVRGRLR